MPCQSYDGMMQAGLTMVDARFELWEICPTFRRARTEGEKRLRWARLQSAKQRAGGVGFTYRSYDDQMAWMARFSAGVEGKRVEPQRQQKQHVIGVEMLGDDGKPPESDHGVTGVVHAEQ